MGQKTVTSPPISKAVLCPLPDTVKLEGAFPRETAGRARALLWNDTGCDPDDPSTWRQPVIRLGMYTQEPFVSAANTAVLHAAFDRLVGARRWQRCMSMGTFPVRFPSPDDPGDAGWHVDASFGYEDPDFMSWRVNVGSKGRALLMLFLFSDVGTEDAPTRIRVGSHVDIARVLAPAGDEGLTLRELAVNRFDETAHRDEVLATADRVFFADILRAVIRRQREIDPMMDEQLATGWSLVRVDSILRAIVRGGVAELLDRDDVPARVAINEYVNVAHVFFSEDEPRVVNGVLDKIARRVRGHEFVRRVTPS